MIKKNYNIKKMIVRDYYHFLQNIQNLISQGENKHF
jgi:hypothetical protein